MKRSINKSQKKPLSEIARSEEKRRESPLRSRLKTENDRSRQRCQPCLSSQHKMPNGLFKQYAPKPKEDKKKDASVRFRSKTEKEKYEPNFTFSQLKNHMNIKAQTDRKNIKNLVESLIVIKTSNDGQKSRSRQHSMSYHAQTKEYVPKITYAFRTKKGVLQSNPYKPNQDSLLIRTKFMQENHNLFAVADGHGIFGHEVSQFVAKNLSKLMQSSLKTLSPTEAFKASLTKLQNGLSDAKINAESSGTTLNSIFIRRNELYCANTGDSRSILITKSKNKSWEVAELSRDHKPDDPLQKQRILKCGGRVEPFRDENGNFLGPARVWVGKQKAQGLAMSRSIGDNISKQVGVIYCPQIIKHKLTQDDKYIIMGSDGLWQFVSNEEASKIILEYYLSNRIEQGMETLLKVAHERWAEDQSGVIDDITIILIFLHQ